jgi:hypothetical protein
MTAQFKKLYGRISHSHKENFLSPGNYSLQISNTYTQLFKGKKWVVLATRDESDIGNNVQGVGLLLFGAIAMMHAGYYVYNFEHY